MVHTDISQPHKTEILFRLDFNKKAPLISEAFKERDGRESNPQLPA